MRLILKVKGEDDFVLMQLDSALKSIRGLSLVKVGRVHLCIKDENSLTGEPVS